MVPENRIYIPLNKRSSDEQPRERLSKYGARNLRTSELIALILRAGSSGQSAVDLADQMLLILRVDRNLSWRDIAIVMEEDVLRQDDGEVKKVETRLRKRFERVKEKLKGMAKAEGLI